MAFLASFVLRSLGSAAAIFAVNACVELLPHAWDAEEVGRLAFLQITLSSVSIDSANQVSVAVVDLQQVTDHPLGDVAERQVGQSAAVESPIGKPHRIVADRDVLTRSE